MEIVKKYPPNWHETITVLNPPYGTVFCYGETIYNPSGLDIPEDIIFHESVHAEQQKQYPSPNAWWTKYVLESQFRFDQELQAYAAQYKFIKRHWPSKSHKEALFELANNLSSIYGIDLSYSQCETQIRLTAKLL